MTLIELKNYIKAKKSGFLIIDTEILDLSYYGIIKELIISFVYSPNYHKRKFYLVVNWYCSGVDPYGENNAYYEYKFKSLEKLLKYLSKKYQIRVNQISLKYKAPDIKEIPCIWFDNDNKSGIYIKNWNSFCDDFETGIFLDKEIELRDFEKPSKFLED